MYLIKVRIEGIESDYWVCLTDCIAIQRSKKRATVFETLAEAEHYAGIVGCAHEPEIVPIKFDSVEDIYSLAIN